MIMCNGMRQMQKRKLLLNLRELSLEFKKRHDDIKIEKSAQWCNKLEYFL